MKRGEKLLTLAEVAEYLRVSKSKLYQERKAGRLRVLRFGGVVRVRERELQRYIVEAAQPGGYLTVPAQSAC